MAGLLREAWRALDAASAVCSQRIEASAYLIEASPPSAPRLSSRRRKAISNSTTAADQRPGQLTGRHLDAALKSYGLKREATALATSK